MRYEMHIISTTHWDREWRYTFQKTRMLLVKMIDHLLGILENNPNYKYYHFDSQTILIEDYLEIKPENEEKLKKFIKDGRILIGPWYVLPDEFLVSGEALVRNLILGYKVSKKFNCVPMNVGYTPFSWGQISQLPQIYSGFGIDTIIFYRGINSLDSEKSEFIWEGADGTKVLTSRLSTLPRYNFWYHVFRRVVHNLKPNEREYFWERNDFPFHMCDLLSYKTDYKILSPHYDLNKNILKESLNNLIKDQEQDFSTKYLLWFQGHDISEPYPELPILIKESNKIMENSEILHSTLPNYMAKLKKEAKDLKIVKGEMRSTSYNGRTAGLWAYVSSTRMYLKLINHEAEKKLIGYAEPFAVINWLIGGQYPKNYLDLAWRYLLRNHPHDSIGGCSIDRVHEDMIYRYNQCQDISEEILEDSIQNIVVNIDTKSNEESPIFLAVFNPLPFERDEVVTAVVDIPRTKEFKSFELKDLDDNNFPISILSIEYADPVVYQPLDSSLKIKTKRVKFNFKTGKLPSLGYKVFKIKLSDKYKRDFKSLIVSDNCMENEYLKVEINSNGTIKLTEKISGKIYNNLGYFEDSGERGNPWLRDTPENNEIYTTLSTRAIVSLIENNSLCAKYKVRIEIDLPESLSNNERSRSSILKKYKIESVITLKSDSKRLDIETTVYNNIEDHRLRVVFPTGIEAKYTYTDGQFDVIQRPVKMKDTSDWVEPLMREFPQNNFTDISDGKNGIAIINEGIKEYEVINDKIVLTFLRCFKLKLCIVEMEDYSYQKGSQCLGKHTFKYSIYPHKGMWYDDKVMDETLKFNYPLRMAQFGADKNIKSKKLSHQAEFIKLPEGVVLSALKQSEDSKGIILRVYNPSEKEIEGIIKINNLFNFKTVQEISLSEEKIIKKLKYNSNLELKIYPKKIVTLKFLNEE